MLPSLNKVFITIIIIIISSSSRFCNHVVTGHKNWMLIRSNKDLSLLLKKHTGTPKQHDQIKNQQALQITANCFH